MHSYLYERFQNEKKMHFKLSSRYKVHNNIIKYLDRSALAFWLLLLFLYMYIKKSSFIRNITINENKLKIIIGKKNSYHHKKSWS